MNKPALTAPLAAYLKNISWRCSLQKLEERYFRVVHPRKLLKGNRWITVSVLKKGKQLKAHIFTECKDLNKKKIYLQCKVSLKNVVHYRFYQQSVWQPTVLQRHLF